MLAIRKHAWWDHSLFTSAFVQRASKGENAIHTVVDTILLVTLQGRLQKLITVPNFYTILDVNNRFTDVQNGLNRSTYD